MWPNVVQYTGIDGGLYFAEYLGTVQKITPPLTQITAEPARTLKVDVKGVASEMVEQEILAFSRVGAEYRFAVNDWGGTKRRDLKKESCLCHITYMNVCMLKLETKNNNNNNQ